MAAPEGIEPLTPSLGHKFFRFIELEPKSHVEPSRLPQFLVSERPLRDQPSKKLVIGVINLRGSLTVFHRQHLLERVDLFRLRPDNILAQFDEFRAI